MIDAQGSAPSFSRESFARQETAAFVGTERFEIIGNLGRGGMSLVHAVLDHRTGRRIALKVLREPRPERLSVLKREFRRVAGVVHPNLVHMHELFDGKDGTFFTMELVEGRRLWDWVRDPHEEEQHGPPRFRPRGYGKPPCPVRGEGAWRRLRYVAGQLATALAALHARDILHRDVKPSNAIVRPDDTVVVLDFGLARSLRDLRPDPFGRIGGTLAYMAPEQLEVGPVGTAADWYAMGATLFELASGCLPYAGDERTFYDAKHARVPPRSLGDVAPEAPGAFVRLVDALLDPEPALRPSRSSILASLGLAPEVGLETMPELHRMEQPPIGREQALAFLEGGMLEANSLGRSIRELRGESGIGKSALARWYARMVRANGGVVFRGFCYERESIPFKAFDRLIDRLVDRIARRGVEGREAIIPGNRRALIRLFPAFRRLPEFDLEEFESESEFSIPVRDSAAIRRDAFMALSSLLARYASGRSILIVLDDVQWADRDSAALAAHLLASPPSPLMLLLCRRREGELPNLQDLAGDRSLPPARSHVLEPLDRADSRVLVRRSLGTDIATPELVEAVVAEADGSPFWLEQLGLFSRAPAHMGPGTEEVRSLVAGSGPLEGLLRAAIDATPAEAQDLLLMLAIAGRPVDRTIAEAIGGMNVLRSADRLEEGGLVIVRRTDSGAGLEVRHGRVAAAALERVSPAAQAAAHARFAKALLATGADPEEISVHLFAAGDEVGGAEYALQGARAACAVLAFDRAARLLGIAHDHETDPARQTNLLIEIGAVLANDCRGEEAARAYLDAADRLDGSQSLELRHNASEQLMRSGRVDEGLALLERLLHGQGLRIHKSSAWGLVRLLGGRARLALRGVEFERRDAADIEPEVLSRLDSIWSAAITLGLVDAVAASVFEVQGLLLALEVGEPIRVGRFLGAEALFHAVFGNHARSDALLERYQAIVDDIDDDAERATLALVRSVAAYQRGDWLSCFDWSLMSLEHLQGVRSNLSWTRSTAIAYRLAAAGHLGRIDEVLAVLPRELEHARARGNLHAVLHLSLAMPVALDAILDRPHAGIEQARRVWEDFPGRHYVQMQIRALSTEASLSLVAADGEAAQEAGRRSWELANRSGTKRLVIVRLSACELALRCEICAAVVFGLDRKRRRLIRSHIQELRRSKMDWVGVCATLGQAQLDLLEGRLAAAVAGFDEAFLGFQELGMELRAEASRYASGELLDGDAGRIERRRAVEWAERGGAVAPLRLFRMLVPAIVRARES